MNDIVIKNLVLDIKGFFLSNFYESNRGLVLIGLLSLYRIKQNIHNIKYIKNNLSINQVLIKKNKTIRVKPSLRCVNHDVEIKDENKNVTLSFRHYPKYNPFSNWNNRNIKINNNNNKPNNYTVPSIDIDGLNIHLACIDSISDEGLHFLKRLIDKDKTFYIKFNHIQYHDTPRIYCWVLYKENFSTHNINVLLVANGYARIGNIKNNDIYDETIYYYHSDIIDAEEDAKLRAVGLWRNMRTPMTAASVSTVARIFTNLKRMFNMSKFEKIILKK